MSINKVLWAETPLKPEVLSDLYSHKPRPLPFDWLSVPHSAATLYSIGRVNRSLPKGGGPVQKTGRGRSENGWVLLGAGLPALLQVRCWVARAPAA